MASRRISRAAAAVFLAVVTTLLSSAPRVAQAAPSFYPGDKGTYDFLNAWVEAIPNLANIWLSPNICDRIGITCSDDEMTVQVTLDSVRTNGYTFTGSLPEMPPEVLGPRVRITSISIRGLNYLRGSLPASWSALSQLQSLDVANTKLSGQIPLSYQKLTKLKAFYAANSYLCYSLPEWNMTAMRNLQTVDVTNTAMQGSLPNSFANASPTFTLAIAKSPFCGCIPESWKTNPNLYSQASSQNATLADGCTRTCSSTELSTCAVAAPPLPSGAFMTATTTLSAAVMMASAIALLF